MTDWESDYEGCMKATAPIPRPNPSIPFDRLLNLNDRAMQSLDMVDRQVTGTRTDLKTEIEGLRGKGK